jgi:hypothetical protein
MNGQFCQCISLLALLGLLLFEFWPSANPCTRVYTSASMLKKYLSHFTCFISFILTHPLHGRTQLNYTFLDFKLDFLNFLQIASYSIEECTPPLKIQYAFNQASSSKT